MKWIDYVKDYAKKNGCSYKEALQKAKHTYIKGGMMKLPPETLKEITKYQRTTRPTQREYTPRHFAVVTGIPQEVKLNDRIQYLRIDFQEVTGIRLDVPANWRKYERFLEYYYDLTELQIAKMSRHQRRRLIREYMNPLSACGPTGCVGSGYKRKKPKPTPIAELEGPLPEPSRVRRPIYTMAQANDFEHNVVPIPQEIVDIRYFIVTAIPELAHSTFVATLLHSVGWTPVDIFNLAGNDIPALRRLILHLSQNIAEYLTPVGSGFKKKMKGSGPSQSKKQEEEEEQPEVEEEQPEVEEEQPEVEEQQPEVGDYDLEEDDLDEQLPEPLPEPSRRRRPVHTARQALTYEDGEVRVPKKIANIEKLLRGIVQSYFGEDLQFSTFVATLLHSVGWTEEDIINLDAPALVQLLTHTSTNPDDYLKPRSRVSEIPPRRTVPVANPVPAAPLSPELYGMRNVVTPYPDEISRFIGPNDDDWEHREVPEALNYVWVPTEEHRRTVRQHNVRPVEKEQEELMFKEKIESFNMFINELSQRTGRSTQFIKDSFDDYLQTVLGITVERCLRSTPDQIDSILINFAKRYYNIRF